MTTIYTLRFFSKAGQAWVESYRLFHTWLDAQNAALRMGEMGIITAWQIVPRLLS